MGLDFFPEAIMQSRADFHIFKRRGGKISSGPGASGTTERASAAVRR